MTTVEPPASRKSWKKEPRMKTKEPYTNEPELCSNGWPKSVGISVVVVDNQGKITKAFSSAGWN